MYSSKHIRVSLKVSVLFYYLWRNDGNVNPLGIVFVLVANSIMLIVSHIILFSHPSVDFLLKGENVN